MVRCGGALHLTLVQLGHAAAVLRLLLTGFSREDPDPIKAAGARFVSRSKAPERDVSRGGMEYAIGIDPFCWAFRGRKPWPDIDRTASPLSGRSHRSAFQARRCAGWRRTTTSRAISSGPHDEIRGRRTR